MAISKIEKPFSIYKKTGTLPNQSGDIIISDFFGSYDQPIIGFVSCYGGQWRNLNIGYQGNNLIVMDSIDEYKNKSFYILCMKSV